MAKKRFTDTEIWDKEWFMDLCPKLKCLIRYLFDNCDAAGVWTPNWKLATLHIGETVSATDLKLLNGQIEILPGGKIFLPDFINFQYGSLSESSPAHKPVFKAIQKNKLEGRVFNRVSTTLQEKDKDKEEDKDKDFGKSENLLTWDSVKQNFLNAYAWKEKFCLDKKIDLHVLEKKMTEFLSDIELREDYKDLKELKSHFTNLFNKNGSHQQTPGSKAKLGTSEARERAARNY